MPEMPNLPPVADQPLSLLLLAHSPQAPFDELVQGWGTELEGRGQPYEILLLDCAHVLPETLSLTCPHARALCSMPPHGVGAALRAGLAAAQYPLLATCDADRQVNPAELKRLLAEIDKVHVVVGCRAGRPLPGWLSALDTAWRATMRVAFGLPLERPHGWLGWRTHWLRTAVRWLTGLRVRDVTWAFRLYRREVFRRVPVQSHGATALVEVLAKANFLGCLMSEVAVVDRPEERTATAEPPAQTRRDRRRVFNQPDFGPAVLPEPPAASAPVVGPASSEA